MFHTWLHNIYLVFFIVILSALVENRSYNNGLIFYDLQTQQAFLPPTVSVSRGRGLSNVKYSDKGSIWSTFGKPCDCAGINCGCCAGIKVKQYDFNEKMCANITFVHQKDEAILDIFLGDKPSARYGISARNPSPFCIPVMLGIPMAMCVQMSNIAVQGNNLNMCMDFIVRLATTDLFEMHFQCMRMGLDGVQYLDKNGQPVLPPGSQLIKYGEAEEDEQSAEYSEYYDELPVANENKIETNENKLVNEIYPTVEQQVEMAQDEVEESYNGGQIAHEAENVIVTTLAPAVVAVAEYDNSVGEVDTDDDDDDDDEEADIGYVAPVLPVVINETQVNAINNYGIAPAVSGDDMTSEENVENTYIAAATVASLTTTTTTTAAPALAAYGDDAATETVAGNGDSVNTPAEPTYVIDEIFVPSPAELNDVRNDYTGGVAPSQGDNIAPVPTESVPYVTVATASYEQLQPVTSNSVDAVAASTLETNVQPKTTKLIYRRTYG